MIIRPSNPNTAASAADHRPLHRDGEGALSLIGALLVWYGTSPTRERSWLHTTTFAATLAITVYVIVDLEFPRMGLIRVDLADQILIDQKTAMR